AEEQHAAPESAEPEPAEPEAPAEVAEEQHAAPEAALSEPAEPESPAEVAAEEQHAAPESAEPEPAEPESPAEVAAEEQHAAPESTESEPAEPEAPAEVVAEQQHAASESAEPEPAEPEASAEVAAEDPHAAPESTESEPVEPEAPAEVAAEEQHAASEAALSEPAEPEASAEVVAEQQHAASESAEPEPAEPEASAEVAAEDPHAAPESTESEPVESESLGEVEHAPPTALNWKPQGVVQTEFTFGEYTVYDYSSKLESINDLKNEIRKLRNELTDLIAAIRQASLIMPDAPKATQSEELTQHSATPNEVIQKHSASDIAKAILPIHNQAPQQQLVVNEVPKEQQEVSLSTQEASQHVAIEGRADNGPTVQTTSDATDARSPLERLKEVVAYHVGNGVSFDGIKYAAIQQEDVKSSIKDALLERGDLINRMLAKPEETKAECYHIMRQSRLPTNVAIGAAIDLNSNNPKLDHLNVEAIKEYTYSTMIGLHDEPATSLLRDYLNGNKDDLTLYNELVELLGEDEAAAYKPINETENTKAKELNQKIEQSETPVPM
ncbi:hypothetical protein PXH84_18650, partial [Vibrio fluvialis]|nr:hypothetical protein [Vibrio fluvialis]